MVAITAPAECPTSTGDQRFASRYPARGVVNVDQWLQAEPLARLFQSLAGQLRGPGFPAAWEMVEASMRIGLLSHEAQELLRSARTARQDLVAGYLRELLDLSAAESADNAAARLAALRAAQVPYLYVAGDNIGPHYRSWLNHVPPGSPAPFRRMPGGHRTVERPGPAGRSCSARVLTLTLRQLLSSTLTERSDEDGAPTWNGRSTR